MRALTIIFIKYFLADRLEFTCYLHIEILKILSDRTHCWAGL